MKIGLFGCGNMGSALALGFNKINPEINFFLYNPTHSKALSLASQINGKVILEITEMPKDLDWYILAFKPQTLKDFHFEFTNNSKILSVLAGISIESLVTKFNSTAIARLMPNTPSSIGEGANLFFSSTKFPDIEFLLKSLGKLFVLETEGQLDEVTAFSGSGPALIFEYGRIFQYELEKILPENLAKDIIAQTFLGSALLMNESLKSNISFTELRENVTSKKGVTYEALKVLNEEKFEQIMQKAFASAYQRLIEIKKGE